MADNPANAGRLVTIQQGNSVGGVRRVRHLFLNSPNATANAHNAASAA